MAVAIIGSGGREHALQWKLQNDLPQETIYVIPGNGGTKNNISLDIMDFKAIKNCCEEKDINLLVVGPEVPLSEGIYDYFEGTSVRVFGPSKAAAVLEGSKIYAKNFMKKYGVATADYKVINSATEAKDYIRSKNGKLVIKYDGLAAGKGVYVCSTVEESLEALADCYNRYGENAALHIEDRIIGPEISIIGITDGTAISLLSPSQDHKQLLDGDLGPNTGGMGAFCPVPFCDASLMEAIQERILKPTLKGIKEEGYSYKGILFLGIMLDEDGPKLLEYNVRLGDPETEVLMPALKSSFYELIEASLNGTIKDCSPVFNPGYFVDVVLVSGGYPLHYEKGKIISGLKEVKQLIFHAGTKQDQENVLTNGGRVLNSVGQGDSLEEAIEDAYKGVASINFEKAFFRKDIGNR